MQNYCLVVGNRFALRALLEEIRGFAIHKVIDSCLPIDSQTLFSLMPFNPVEYDSNGEVLEQASNRLKVIKAPLVDIEQSVSLRFILN